MSRKVHLSKIARAIYLLIFIASLVPFPQIAYAGAIITVNTAVDAIAVDGLCSLREAITAANTNATANECVHDGSISPDTINLPAGVINLTGALPALAGDLTIQGSGAASSIIRRNSGGDYRFFSVPNGFSLSISGLTLENGRTPGFSSGGAIENSGALVVDNVVFLGNFATADGGAIVNNNAASTLNIRNATFSGNHANYDGGGIRINDGAVVVDRSTFTQNSTGFSGAALRLISGTLQVKNSTLSDNDANFNGGAFEGSTANASFIHTTITGNTAVGTGGGLYGGTIQNSIIYGNTAGSGPDIRGTITSLGYNLVGNTTNAAGFVASDLLNANPQLGSLGENGGPTPTIPLYSGSPALNAIPNGINGCGTTWISDQRGAARPAGTACDIGAFEGATSLIDFNGLPAQTEAAAISTLNSTYAAQDVSFDFHIPSYALPGWGFPVIGDGNLDVATHPAGADMLVNFAVPVDSVSINFLATGNDPSGMWAYDRPNDAGDNSFDGNLVDSVLGSTGVLSVSGSCIRSVQFETVGFSYTVDDLAFTLMSGPDYDNDGLIDECDPDTLVVNSTGDGADFIPGDGVCEVSGGGCTLRAAVEEANAQAGLNNILFSIPGAGIQTISLSSPLPDLSEPTVIDGWTQPGFASSPLIQLSAVYPAVANALTVAGGNSRIRGLIINGFYGTGINLISDGNIIEGNYLGTNAAGTAAAPTSGALGIGISNGSNNLVGGSTLNSRNVISGNYYAGILLSGISTGNQILGNYVGTNAAGTAAIPNGSGSGYAGIFVSGTSSSVASTVIGGSEPGERNVISGNNGDGIGLWDGATGTVIQGNYIGVASDGVTPLGNNGAGAGGGIAIRNHASASVIGGSTIGEGNVIANNAPAGIMAYSGSGNAFRVNSIYANSGPGIDLGGDILTPNDPGDGDVGANNQQNFPVLVVSSSTGITTTVQGTLNSTANTSFDLDFYASLTCENNKFGEGQVYLGSTLASTNGSGNASFNAILPVGANPGEYVTATATDPSGNTSEFSACSVVSPPLIDLNNRFWTDAYNLSLVPNTLDPDLLEGSAIQHLFFQEQTAWFKFTIAPGERVIATLSNLPANYDLTLYKDIAAQAVSATTQEELLVNSAEFLPDFIRPDFIRPDFIRPDFIRPDFIRPDFIRPDFIRPDFIRPDFIRPDFIRPDFIRPDFIRPEDTPQDAYSNAQNQSLLTFSANEGNANEIVIQNTWENTGYYYLRVRGRNGIFSTNAPFHLDVSRYTSVCSIALSQPLTQASNLAASADASSYKTLILTDLSRIEGTTVEKTDLWNMLVNDFAARPEVSGKVLNVGSYPDLGLSGDARVLEARGVAEANLDCPFAQNLVAGTIKSIIDSYRALNPSLEYIVLVGGDEAIPFFRHTEQVPLGQENTYYPPVRDFTRSFASLMNSTVLSQDRYGAQKEISNLNRSFPIPNLPVGRLVETALEAKGMIQAYLNTSGGVVATPTSSLVVGYDFMTVPSQQVQDELEAGIGSPASILITERDVDSSAAPCPDGSLADAVQGCPWTAENLRAKLLGSRHDVIYLAGHFSQGATLAADYKTRLSAAELASSPLDLENVILFSAGCHAGYNTVNADTLEWTEYPDWAQAAAQKRMTLVAGTGYQYGDTDVTEYSARLYLEFSKQLRTGSGPVSVGRALVNAKLNYLATTPHLTGIHDKAVLQTTLFGLPMLKVDMPFQRLPAGGDPSIVSGTTPIGSLGLSSADVSVSTVLTTNSKTLYDENGAIAATATYLSGTNGVTAEPDELVLPLEIRNISASGAVARGAGFRSGSYTDASGVVPLTGAPATEVRETRAFFNTQVFYPTKLWGLNYFDALGSAGGDTRLMLTPAQFVSSSPTSPDGTLRKFSSMDFRMFYSSNPAIAQAGKPSIASISAVDGGSEVQFSVRAQGNPLADVQAVWVTFTGTSGPFSGLWQSLDLVRNGIDPELWDGSLPLGSASAADLRFIVQAVNDSGLIALDTNAGAFYVPGPQTPPPAAVVPTSLALQLSQPSASYRSTASFTASLIDANGLPLSNTEVIFGLGNRRVVGVTDGSGTASASIELTQTPGDYSVTAAFAGDSSRMASEASAAFTVDKLSTSLSLMAPSTNPYGEPTPIVATLKDQNDAPVVERTVFFVVSGPATYYRSAKTDAAGQAPLSLALPAGSYTVNAYFVGQVPVSPVTTLALVDSLYQPSTASANLAVVDADPPLIGFLPDLVVEATNPSGAEMFFATAASDANPANPVVTCVPPSGFTFPLGMTTVTCSATDAAGNTATRSFIVTVLPPPDNIPPAASPTHSPAANGNGWNNTDVTVTWNWADNANGSGIDFSNCTTSSVSSGEGTLTLSASCADLLGNVGNATYNVKVDKTAPMLNIVTPQLYDVQPIGTALNFGANDLLSGVGSLQATLTSGSGVVLVNNGEIPVAGVYTFILTATDNAGNTITSEPHMLVIYDPNGGYVTGGGWIWSAPGSCQDSSICNTSAEGRANFGFVSKYKKGVSVPTGNTEFTFQAGGLNFHSGNYEWLVVNQAGTNAQYKGTGTINGFGEYKFMLWATDGAGTGNSDTFRIRIWREGVSGEQVVYDNGFDQEIGGGNIKVHNGK